MFNDHDPELADAFAQVLDSAHAADIEAMDEFIGATTADMNRLLDEGEIPIDVYQRSTGETMVGVPETIMASMIEALNEACELSQQISHQASIGNAAVLLDGFYSDLQVKALAMKGAFICLALARHYEEKMGL